MIASSSNKTGAHDDWHWPEADAGTLRESQLETFELLRQLQAILEWLGRGLINAQPQPDGRELDEGEEVGGVFLITRRNTTTVLDPVEEPLDQIAVFVKVRTEADR